MKNTSFEAAVNTATGSADDTITLGKRTLRPHSTILKPMAHTTVLRPRTRTRCNASIPNRTNARTTRYCPMLAAARRGGVSLSKAT
jgi:hypothetical protein